MVNWNRIFDSVSKSFDEEATLKHIEHVINELQWTGEMAEALDSIIIREENANDLAARLDIAFAKAIKRQDLGYRTLRKMADDKWIHYTKVHNVD